MTLPVTALHHVPVTDLRRSMDRQSMADTVLLHRKDTVLLRRKDTVLHHRKDTVVLHLLGRRLQGTEDTEAILLLRDLMEAPLLL